MRIGIILPEFPSYTETFFLNQVKGLCERGCQVFVFCTVKNKDISIEESYGLNKYPNLKVVVLNVRTLAISGIVNVFLNPFIFFRDWDKKESFTKSVFIHLSKVYLRKFDCDIYHFGYSGPAISYLPMMKYLPGKIVISCRGTAENVKPLTEAGRIVKLYHVFEAADKIHCVSGQMAALTKRYGASKEKVFINRPAVNINYFKRNIPYKENRQIQILSVGRLIFQKGLITGVLAIRELVKCYTNFKWIIAGDGPQFEELVFQVNQFGLNNHIILAGKKSRDEVFGLYQESDIFFLPSVSEGIANVVLEAMAMELPVLSSDAGGASEVITHNHNGIVCNIYDYQKMAKALFELCVNFEKRRQLGENARKRIEEDYTIKRYIDVFEREYKELIKQDLP